MENKTINISMSAKDLQLVNDFCNAHNLTRSKFFVQCVLDRIQQEELLISLQLLSSLMSKYDKKDVLTADDKLIIERAMHEQALRMQNGK